MTNLEQIKNKLESFLTSKVINSEVSEMENTFDQAVSGAPFSGNVEVISGGTIPILKYAKNLEGTCRVREYEGGLLLVNVSIDIESLNLNTDSPMVETLSNMANMLASLQSAKPGNMKSCIL